MRKLLNIIALSTVVLMSSCDMQKMPIGYVNPEDAFKTEADIEYQTNGIYARLRDNYITSNVVAADIQADYVNAALGFSNTYGDFYKWVFTQNDNDIASTWQKCYFTIAQCNFVLDNVGKVETESSKGDKIVSIANGTAHLARAMSYSMLVDRFCQAYKAETAQTAYSGVPLIETYDPSLRMPDRASLYDVYALILEDLELAVSELGVLTGGEVIADATKFNVNTAKAMQARIYLNMGMYDQAYKAANEVISQPIYAMSTSNLEFDSMWDFDSSKEIIFKLYASKTELPEKYGTSFFYDTYSGIGNYRGSPLYGWRVDYLPTQDLIDLIKPEDYRSHWIFIGLKGGSVEQYSLGQYIVEKFTTGANPTPIAGVAGYSMLMKFSGNEDLLTSSAWNYCNAWKPIRLAEMYLIAAEAGLYAAGGDAKTPLNTLRKHRGLTELPVVTLAEVKAERYLELMLEGFRIPDLKRWGDGMKHGTAQRAGLSKQGVLTDLGQKWDVVETDTPLSIPIARDLVIAPGDFRFVWPIPAAEIYANQNLSGQQNPGWNNR